jgi:hypothetical protein
MKRLLKNKNAILLVAFLLVTQICFAQSTQMRNTVSSGIGIGTIIAMIISWGRNKSILWCIFHGFCGWLYVIYYFVTK